MLVITSFMLVVFFGTGLYTQKIVRPKQHEKSCKRVLRDFNMTFSQDRDDGQLHLIRRKIPASFVDNYGQFKMNRPFSQDS